MKQGTSNSLVERKLNMGKRAALDIENMWEKKNFRKRLKFLDLVIYIFIYFLYIYILCVCVLDLYYYFIQAAKFV